MSCGKFIYSLQPALVSALLKNSFSTAEVQITKNQEKTYLIFFPAAIAVGCSFQQCGKWENKRRQKCFSWPKPKKCMIAELLMKATFTQSLNYISNNQKPPQKPRDLIYDSATDLLYLEKIKPLWLWVNWYNEPVSLKRNMPPYTVASQSLFYYNEKFRQNLEVAWINTGVKITDKKKKSTSFPMENLSNK